jgi:hypothetical protein
MLMNTFAVMCSKLKKLSELNIKHKTGVDMIHIGFSQQATAVHFYAAKLTVGNINNKYVILKAWEGNYSSRRKGKLYITETEAVFIAVLQHFRKVAQWTTMLVCQCFRKKPNKLHRYFLLKVFC